MDGSFVQVVVPYTAFHTGIGLSDCLLDLGFVEKFPYFPEEFERRVRIYQG